MSERKPKLKWERVDVGPDGWHQHQAKAGDLLDLLVDEPLDNDPAVWIVECPDTDIELQSGEADDIEAAKLAAEDYALAELVKAVASFGATIAEATQ